ncbi:hypothetical protein AGMMS49991_01300 [Spirochaetia bacterium]|nr:hypothetical protein AGMMS49991_01300 [Spirochaetia bacterium]
MVSGTDLVDKMAKFINTENRNDNPDNIWYSEALWYKGFATIEKHRIPYKRYKLFKAHPEQAAQEIVQLVQMLEQG